MRPQTTTGLWSSAARLEGSRNYLALFDPVYPMSNRTVFRLLFTEVPQFVATPLWMDEFKPLAEPWTRSIWIAAHTADSVRNVQRIMRVAAPLTQHKLFGGTDHAL